MGAPQTRARRHNRRQDLLPTNRRAYQSFRVISFHDLDLEIPLGHELLQPPFSCSNWRSRLTSAGSSCPNCFRHV
jgi:hypothetical protein